MKQIAFLLLPFLINGCQPNLKKEGEKIKITGSENIEAAVTTGNVIPYTVAKNYFVKNSVTDTVACKITTRNEFDRLFGMATIMGENGKPTPVDFDKEYVIAVIRPVTDSSTTLIPVSLEKTKEDAILFSYKTETGKKQTYSVHPCLIIVVDKRYNGTVTIQEI